MFILDCLTVHVGTEEILNERRKPVQRDKDGEQFNNNHMGGVKNNCAMFPKIKHF